MRVLHFPMTTAQFRRWLKAEIRWLQAHETAAAEQVYYDAGRILADARQHAITLGLPNVAELLDCRSTSLSAIERYHVDVGMVSPLTAQAMLSAATAALPSDKLLTPPQVAKKYGVSPATVRGWIESGELKATNIASKGKRPMHRITSDALAEFDAKRCELAPPPAKRRRRRKGETIVSRY